MIDPNTAMSAAGEGAKAVSKFEESQSGQENKQMPMLMQMPVNYKPFGTIRIWK